MPKHLLHAGFALAILALALGKAAVPLGWTPPAHVLEMCAGECAEVDATTVLFLDTFDVLRYPSGKIRQYESAVKTLDRAGQRLGSAVIRVNHPLRLKGWWIYQYGWGQTPTGELCTQLYCVKDLALPLAALAGLLLLAGSLGLCVSRRRRGASIAGVAGRRGVVRWGAALLTISLPLFIIGRAVLRPEPVPALQSPLMAPHVAAYTASYLILLFAAFGIGRRFVPLGFFLMTLGLVLGALWGKMAWGHWWQFDPKENWSFFTWLAFAVSFHFPSDSRKALWLQRLGAILILITLTWVNFSRLMSGLHSYA